MLILSITLQSYPDDVASRLTGNRRPIPVIPGLRDKLEEGVMNKIFAIAISGVLMTGCTSAATHRADVQDDSMDRVTVGTVQKEIYVGMSGAEVASILSSPNIVSTDANRDEAGRHRVHLRRVDI